MGSNKLRNVEAVKKMMMGTHKSQTRKTFGFTDAKQKAAKVKKREVGDVWEEKDPVSGTIHVWEQKEGFRVKRSKNWEAMDEIRNSMTVPEKCPHCDTRMRNHEKKLNFKFWFTRKKCYSCVLAEESKYRMKGPEAWKEYQNSIMSKNVESWLRDAEREMEIAAEKVTETYWQNADGRTGEIDITQWNEKVRKDFEEFKAKLLKEYGIKNGRKEEQNS